MFNLIFNACSFPWLKPTDVCGETWKCLFTTFSQPNWQSFRGSAGKNSTKSWLAKLLASYPGRRQAEIAANYWENTLNSKCTMFHFFILFYCTNVIFTLSLWGLIRWTVMFIIFLVFLRPSFNSCYQCASRWKHIQDNGARGLQMSCQDKLSSLDEEQEYTLNMWRLNHSLV